jgi:hypothetical protein
MEIQRNDLNLTMWSQNCLSVLKLHDGLHIHQRSPQSKSTSLGWKPPFSLAPAVKLVKSE